MKPTLLILAAGMGSRYGGLKQMDSIGPHAESIIDYSVYDALQAGFGKVVFVIQESFATAFREAMVDKLQDRIATEVVYQNLNDLPEGFSCPASRSKAWGTGHAVWSARKVIKEPFAVINADDFYGRNNYTKVVDYFSEHPQGYAMVAYPLRSTLSEQGSVSRGICKTDGYQQLLSVMEHTQIVQQGERILSLPEGIELPGSSLVSMNSWALQPGVFKEIEEAFSAFLQQQIDQPDAELFLPYVIMQMIEKRNLKLKVLTNVAEWFGVTYKADKELAVQKISTYIQNGYYPPKLWSE